MVGFEMEWPSLRRQLTLLNLLDLMSGTGPIPPPRAMLHEEDAKVGFEESGRFDLSFKGILAAITIAAILVLLLTLLLGH